MTVADLHIHTTNSDGTLTIDQLPDAARKAGLNAVAVTDHDRTHPELSSPVTTRDGITIIHGIELRVETDTQQLDLLGYGLDPTRELLELIERLQTDRVERARKIVECVESRLGVSLSVSYEPGVGRPHIARAVADSDAEMDYEEAFAQLIGSDCPCYVARDIPSFERGRDLLKEACRVVGLAHPFRYDDPAAALGRTETLDAVELFYPYGRAVDTGPARQARTEHDLLVTGGSDAHDLQLGRAGLDQEEFRRFERSIDG